MNSTVLNRFSQKTSKNIKDSLNSANTLITKYRGESACDGHFFVGRRLN